MGEKVATSLQYQLARKKNHILGSQRVLKLPNTDTVSKNKFLANHLHWFKVDFHHFEWLLSAGLVGRLPHLPCPALYSCRIMGIPFC